MLKKTQPLSRNMGNVYWETSMLVAQFILVTQNENIKNILLPSDTHIIFIFFYRSSSNAIKYLSPTWTLMKGKQLKIKFSGKLFS